MLRYEPSFRIVDKFRASVDTFAMQLMESRLVRKSGRTWISLKDFKVWEGPSSLSVLGIEAGRGGDRAVCM